ncbi:membrane protein [Rhizobium phage vB_RleM_P10VF]|uniref:DUF3307 domain-containing protein n=1 Tax=Rhizobium phage vB_RleM_P10VF TaxID=1527770 RepID=A0A076YKK9_9CAUD|nr:membrane protein [Rhizobium phage vB_RleM_P10VF]AIK68317.1 hypothetical protein P10VF_104 [Rhizobium phage vB_RleM_P10VF]
MIFTNPLALFFLLLFAHYVADYPMQQFLCRVKNPNRKRGIDDDIADIPWTYGMTAHCGIHAGFVLMLTGSVIFAMIEFVVHFATDWLKCENWIGYRTDQFIHVATKAVFVALIFHDQLIKFSVFALMAIAS